MLDVVAALAVFLGISFVVLNVVLGVLWGVLRVARLLLEASFGVALIIFGRAGELGFLGVAAYFACWIFFVSADARRLSDRRMFAGGGAFERTTGRPANCTA
jgi:hypothetical protein